MSTQIRMRSAVTGSNQPRLDDYAGAVNDFLGVTGNRWNDKAGGGRWDAGAVFDDKLAAVSGNDLVAILQHIDNFDFGNTDDTSITTGSLGLAQNSREANFNSNSLRMFGMTTAELEATSIELDSSTTIEASAQSTNLTGVNSGVVNELRHYEASTNGAKYIAFKPPTALLSTYTMQLPNNYASADGYVLRVASGGGTGNLTMEWAAENVAADDTSITGGSLVSASQDRTADFANHSLLLDAMTTFTANSSGLTTFQNTGLQIDHATASTGGKLLLQDGDTNTAAFQAPVDVTSTYTYTLPAALPAGPKVLQIDATGQWSYTDITSHDKPWRGVWDASSNDYPEAAEATVNPGTGFLAGEYMTISVGGTLNGEAVSPGDLLIVLVDTPGQIDSNWEVVGIDTDTHFLSTDLAGVGNRVHTGGGFNFTMTNFGNFDFVGTSFDFDVAAGSAISVVANRDITLAGYAGSGKDGTANRNLLVDTNGKLVTADVPLTMQQRSVLQFDTDYLAGTTINLDGTSTNQTLVAPSPVISLSGINNQAELFAAAGIDWYVDGIKADTSNTGDAHCTVNFVSASSVSLDRDFPAGTILEIEKRV